LGSDPGALERRLRRQRAEVGRRLVLQAPPIAPDGGAGGGRDHDFLQEALLAWNYDAKPNPGLYVRHVRSPGRVLFACCAVLFAATVWPSTSQASQPDGPSG